MPTSSEKYSVAAAIGLGVLAATAWKRSNASRLHGKLVLITGGSRGLGLALAQEFGRHGARIAICARDSAELDRACHKLRQQNIEATPFVADVSDPKVPALLVQSISAQLGPISVLINNAGIIRVGPFASASQADYEDALNLMFWAPFHLSQAVIPHFEQQGGGSIINISSIGGRVSIPHLLPYSCAKFALVALSSGMAAELKLKRIHVLTVTPGLMRTGSFLNARFAGNAKDEFAWFGILGNLPGFSVGVEYAAAQVRKAWSKRQFDCTISLPAKMLARFDAFLPNISRSIMSGVNALLPRSGHQQTLSGHSIDRQTTESFRKITLLGRTAASQFNE